MRIVGTRALDLAQKRDVRIVGTASVPRWSDPSCWSLVSGLAGLYLDAHHLICLVLPHIF